MAALVLGALVAAGAPAFAHSRRPARHEADVAPAGADPAARADAAFGDPRLAEAPDWSPRDTGGEPSGVAARLADWVVASDDNAGLPFMIVDKLAADVFAFDSGGRLLGHAPVLVGLAPGDDSAPGVGELKLSQISPDERTTPAGRFVARLGPSSHGTVLWVDYADAISMHPVITTNPKEHRLQRIRSASPEEHRISFGCINVPAQFYHDIVAKDRRGVVVYVLPDTKPLDDVFPAFVAADEAAADAGPRSAPDPCANPSLDLAGRIEESDPGHVCAAQDDPPTVAAEP